MILEVSPDIAMLLRLDRVPLAVVRVVPSWTMGTWRLLGDSGQAIAESESECRQCAGRSDDIEQLTTGSTVQP